MSQTEAAKPQQTKPRGVGCTALVRLYWRIRGEIWMWQWGRWISAVLRMEPRLALMCISRTRWKVVHGGYSEDWQEVYLKSLQTIEDFVRSKANAQAVPNGEQSAPQKR